MARRGVGDSCAQGREGELYNARRSQAMRGETRRARGDAVQGWVGHGRRRKCASVTAGGDHALIVHATTSRREHNLLTHPYEGGACAEQMRMQAVCRCM